MERLTEFFRRGWLRFPRDERLLNWLKHAAPAALAAASSPENRAQWLRCEGTWFAGVDVLGNDAEGRIGRSGPFCGAAADFVAEMSGWPLNNLHKGQVSVVYPGYPRPNEGESEAAFNYRRDRDAAHLDGLLPVGTPRHRMIREPHAFILGLPVTEADPDAAPLVVWDGSHRIMRKAMEVALAPHDPANWPNIDVTEAYQAARRAVFETGHRVELPAQPGEAILLHRHALHGIAPWREGATADPSGRAIIYFRPMMPGGVEAWLSDP